jgi:hypothetical protein
MDHPIPDDIVRRRDAIGVAISSLERALAAAAGTGEAWRAHVAAEVGALHHLVVEQVAAYEAPDGVFEEIVERAPRLAPRVERVRQLIEPLDGRLRDLASSVPTAEPDAVRDDAVTVLADIARARHRIADLVWDACSVDIGGPA